MKKIYVYIISTWEDVKGGVWGVYGNISLCFYVDVHDVRCLVFVKF